MIEVEAKVRINDIEGMAKRLKGEGAEYKGLIKQADEYFDFSDIRIFNSGGAFRVRELTNINLPELYHFQEFLRYRLTQINTDLK